MTAWGEQKVRYSTHAPPKDNYILDRDEEQEENVMAAGRANLQQWVVLSKLAAIFFTCYCREHIMPINSQASYSQVLVCTLHTIFVRGWSLHAGLVKINRANLEYVHTFFMFWNVIAQ